MKLAQSVRIGAWFFIGLNLLMAFGAIWVFIRMAPAIEVIIDRNERSLQACEEMLSCLAIMTGNISENKILQNSFMEALKRAQNNITEKDEPDSLRLISDSYHEAFQGNIVAKKYTVAAIIQLGEINRAAMIKADKQARQFGNAGAWGIVFMAIIVFFAGMLFTRSLSNNLVKPLEEIHSVIISYRDGDAFRRCTGSNLPKDIKTIYTVFNEFLDKKVF